MAESQKTVLKNGTSTPYILQGNMFSNCVAMQGSGGALYINNVEYLNMTDNVSNKY